MKLMRLRNSESKVTKAPKLRGRRDSWSSWNSQEKLKHSLRLTTRTKLQKLCSKKNNQCVWSTQLRNSEDQYHEHMKHRKLKGSKAQRAVQHLKRGCSCKGQCSDTPLYWSGPRPPLRSRGSQNAAKRGSTDWSLTYKLNATLVMKVNKSLKLGE